MARGNPTLTTQLVNRSPQRTFDLDVVRSLLLRETRESTGLFWAEGCRNLHAALDLGRRLDCVVVCSPMLRSRQSAMAVNHLQRTGTPCICLASEEFLSVSTHQEPQGVGAILRQEWQPLINVSLQKRDIWIVLDNIRTPGNLGTILRTAAAVDAQGVMLIGGETDPFDPACIRASMGAIFRQKLVRTSAKALIGWRKRHPCRVIGTSPNADMHYRKANYNGPLLLLMGNERTGLRERQRDLCDTVVKLPMAGNVDSLNLAVATGIVLYEAYEQMK